MCAVASELTAQSIPCVSVVQTQLDAPGNCVQVIKSFIQFSQLAFDCATFAVEETNQIQFLTSNDVGKLLELGTGPNTEIPFKTAHHSFEVIAKENPNLTAIEFGRLNLSYGEMNERAEILSQKLIHSGVGKTGVVPIITARNIEFFVAMFAVLKSGAAFIPIDKSLPKERLSIILKDSKCNHVLYDPSISANLIMELKRNHEHIAINLTNSIFTPAPAMPVYQKPIIDEHDPAYVVYTSGSTGKPKGVVIKHISVSNFANIAIPSTYEVKSKRWASILSIN
ncbi:hypothetical protein BC833DRAFT_557113, partial [Globomyces pollinis-pini]